MRFDIFLWRLTYEEVPQQQITSFVPSALRPFLSPSTHTVLSQDILGNSESNEIILDVVSGCGDRVEEVIHSDIVAFASKIKWDED